MNQQQQENKSLALELNKYLSHWKALGLFSQHVQRSAGGRCSPSRGAGVLQEAFVRAGGVLGGSVSEGRWCRGVFAAAAVSLPLFAAPEERCRGRSPSSASCSCAFLLLSRSLHPAASSVPFPKAIRALCAASPLPQLPWDTGAPSPPSLRRILLKPPCWRWQPGLRGRGGE